MKNKGRWYSVAAALAMGTFVYWSFKEAGAATCILFTILILWLCFLTDLLRRQNKVILSQNNVNHTLTESLKELATLNFGMYTSVLERLGMSKEVEGKK